MVAIVIFESESSPVICLIIKEKIQSPKDIRLALVVLSDKYVKVCGGLIRR